MNDSAATPGARLRSMTELAMLQMQRVSELESQLEEAKRAFNRTQQTDLPELLKELGLTETTLADLGVKLTLTMGVDVSIPEAQRPDAYAWMAQKGYGDLVRAEVSVVFGATELERAEQCAVMLQQNEFESQVKMAVPAPTLKAWARDRLAAGEDLPPELFNVRAYDMARISNATPKRKR